ncbi:MAG TPA: LLM class flavin-dependent oxidoreductase [Alphaproteobacteria bacterium]|nr:LLM class flavin-dependent oxidoreductase [Alphaproteobacteria bacterium]
MQFGLQLNSQHPATDNIRRRLEELIEQVRLAQRVGFHSIVAPQHYLAAPFHMLQPLPLLARLAAEAGDMRLIAGIILLALQQPVALAEEVGTLDAICNGRFTLGVALGYRDVEFQAFGVAKQDAVPRMIEALTVLKRLWTEDTVEHRGRFFTLPGVTLTTRPVQRPHPPIWMGADNDAAVKRAARLADTWYINPHAKLETLERQMALYRNTLDEVGKAFPTELPIRRELFVAKDRETALRICMPYLERKYQTYVAWGQSGALPQGDTLDLPFETLRDQRFIIGSPEDCIEQLQHYHERLGANHFLLRIQWAGMPQEQVLEAIALFGEQVIPQLLHV